MTNFRNIFILLAAFLAFISLSACQGGQSGGADGNIDRTGDAPAAKVNNSVIYVSDVERAAIAQGQIKDGAPLSPASPIFKTTLDELIDQRLLALDASTRSLDKDTEAQRRLATAREKILGNIRVEAHLKDTVTEANIERLYEEQTQLAKRGEERRARHIVVETEKEAAGIIAKLEEDEGDFGALAKKHSLDLSSAKKGGDLGFFSRDMLGADFTRPVFGAKIGERLEPFKTEYGWHIVEVLDRRTAKPPDFETLRPEIINFMTFEAIEMLITELREKSDVTLLYDSAENAAPNAAPDDQPKPVNEAEDKNE